MRCTFASLLLFVCLFSTSALAFGGLFGSSAEKVAAQNGVVVLDMKELANGESKHFQFQEGATTIRFFVVRDNQGALRTALDACDVCWHADKGYKQQDGSMQCVNCGQFFALGRIGDVKGGCNPHPIAFTVEGNTLNVTAQELLAGAGFFPGNK